MTIISDPKNSPLKITQDPEKHSDKLVDMIHTVLWLLLVSPLWAADVLEGPCRGDVMAFCKSLKPGSGRILRCLRRNEDRLSPACKEHRQAKAAEIRQRMLACQADADKFCKDIRPGRGRIHKCLKNREEELSPSCLSEIEKVK